MINNLNQILSSAVNILLQERNPDKAPSEAVSIEAAIFCYLFLLSSIGDDMSQFEDACIDLTQHLHMRYVKHKKVSITYHDFLSLLESKQNQYLFWIEQLNVVSEKCPKTGALFEWGAVYHLIHSFPLIEINNKDLWNYTQSNIKPITIYLFEVNVAQMSNYIIGQIDLIKNGQTTHHNSVKKKDTTSDDKKDWRKIFYFVLFVLITIAIVTIIEAIGYNNQKDREKISKMQIEMPQSYPEHTLQQDTEHHKPYGSVNAMDAAKRVMIKNNIGVNVWSEEKK